jgi:predicted nucleic-acid-binding protein
MTGLDTNVLVRYIVRDDVAQTRAATRMIETRCTTEEPGLIASIVLCELVWVLDRGYHYERDLISRVIRRLLTVTELKVQDSDLAWQALEFYEESAVDFADFLIGLQNLRSGAEATYTFDRRASKTPHFRVLES